MKDCISCKTKGHIHIGYVLNEYYHGNRYFGRSCINGRRYVAPVVNSCAQKKALHILQQESTQLIDINKILALRNNLEVLRWNSYINANMADILNQMSIVNGSILERIELLDPKGDDKSYIKSNLLKLKIEQIPEIRALVDYFEYQEYLSPEIAIEKVFELCKLRNSYAIEAGYSSYPHLALSSQGFPDKINNYDSILQYIQEPSPLNLSNLTAIEDYWNYYANLAGDGIPSTIIDSNTINEFIIQLLLLLGEENHKKNLTVVVNYETGYNVAFDLTEDNTETHAGILICPRGIQTFFTCAHELGHALLFLNQKTNKYFLPAWLNETYAILLENNTVLLKQAFCKIMAPEDAARLIKNRALLKEMELRRIYASLLVEIDLWRMAQRETNLKTRVDYMYDSYSKYNNKYLGSEFKNKLGWYRETFRTIDPVYIHSYILAEKYHAIVEKYLYLTDYDTIQKILDSG